MSIDHLPEVDLYPLTTQPDVKKGLSGTNKSIALGSGVLVVVGLATGAYLATRGGGEPTEPIALPGVSAPETPGAPVSVAPIDTAPVSPSVPSGSVTSIEVPKTVPVSPELTRAQKVEALKVPGGLSDQEIAETYASRFSEWVMAGATPENLKAWQATFTQPNSLSALDWAKKTAQENASVYQEALFGTGPKSAQFDKNAYDYFVNRNANAIWLYLMTGSQTDPLDKVPYAISFTTGTVTIPGKDIGSETRISFSIVEGDNSDKNRASSILAQYNNSGFNGNKDVVTLRLYGKSADGTIMPSRGPNPAANMVIDDMDIQTIAK